MAPHAARRPERPEAPAPAPPDHYGATASPKPDAPAPPSDTRLPQHALTPSQSSSPAPPARLPRRRLLALGALVVFLVAAGGVAALTGAVTTQKLLRLASWFETLGPKAAALYALLYCALALLAVPALPLTLGAGYLFGAVTGTVVVSVGSTLAALCAFLIARYGLRDAVTSVAERYPRFRAIDRAIAREGFKFVFLLRLSPLLPFSISNYLYGLTSVDWLKYLVASWLGMLPGTVAYVSAGAAVSTLTDLDKGKPSVNPALLVVGLVATVCALTMVGKLAAEAVTTAAGEESDADAATERS